MNKCLINKNIYITHLVEVKPIQIEQDHKSSKVKEKSNNLGMHDQNHKIKNPDISVTNDQSFLVYIDDSNFSFVFQCFSKHKLFKNVPC